MGVKNFDYKPQDPVLETTSYPITKPKCCTYQIWKKKFFRIAGALKLHFFGFSVLTINEVILKNGNMIPKRSEIAIKVYRNSPC